MVNKKTTHKNFLFLLTLFASPLIFGKKANTLHKNKNNEQTTVHLSFIAQEPKIITDVVSKENADYCIEKLKELAGLQKQRKLTLEEITEAMQIFMFLYIMQTDEYSKHMSITIGNEELILPYSLDLLRVILLGKPSDNQTPNEQ